jgi:hypothetical protein
MICSQSLDRAERRMLWAAGALPLASQAVALRD